MYTPPKNSEKYPKNARGREKPPANDSPLATLGG